MNDNDNALDPAPPQTPEIDLTTLSEPEMVSTEKFPLVIEKRELDIVQSQESTRARIAVLFTYFFLFIITLAFIAPFILSLIDATLVPNPLDMSKNLVTEVASVLAGPFGFIVGFYFKQETK